jgi:predicted 2-oxoglutarate/Fe(II)-dependent dioxygenase YbiX/peroxiredoxin
MTTARSSPLGIGEAAPWFGAPVLSGASSYTFDVAGGRIVLLLFFGRGADESGAAALAAMRARRNLFNDTEACFYGITVDPSDAEQGRIAQQIPGIRFFLDYDRAVSRLYGAADAKGDAYRPHWLLLDRTLRVAGRFAIDQGDLALDALAALVSLPAAQDWAPVITVPDLLEREMCRRLIDLYEADGGEDSGFMRDVDGKTKLVLDPKHKVRRDYLIEDPELARQLNLRLIHRLVPMIRRAFQFEATRVERLIVGCYEAETGGHFRPHRDNTTKGTAHRRFAVTVNLNAEDYEGGDLRFPEYGARTYRAPTGGAIVFSCALLHEATPVTKGRRFAFLPFLYDEESARLREQNARFLEGDLANYKAGSDVVVR